MRREWILALAVPLAMQSPPERAASERALRYLALGDSYTIGEMVDAGDRWPVQLARLLRARRVEVGDPELIARTGWTTDELAAAIARAAPAGPYDLVTLLIGVNNQYRGLDAERYRAEFRSLLAQAIGFAGGRSTRVVVLSIPDWGATPFADGQDRARIAREIDRFNAINREETTRARARYVDVTAASREAREGWVAGDGLHPSGRQYARWAEMMVEVVEEILNGRNGG